MDSGSSAVLEPMILGHKGLRRRCLVQVFGES